MTRDELESLMTAHQANVWRYLRFLGCDRSLADDLTQETFLNMYRSTREISINEPKAIASYLRQHARYLFLNAMRRKDIERRAHTEVADTIWNHNTQDEGMQTYFDILEKCLETIDQRSRVSIDLRYKQKLSPSIIAKRMELKEAGLRTLLLRAKKRLRACIEKRLNVQEEALSSSSGQKL